MATLTEDRWAELQRIARYCARSWQSGAPLPFDRRADAALDGIVAAFADGIDDDHALIRAGQMAVARHVRAVTKDHGHALGYWVPPGDADGLAERVTERVAVWQVAWAFTEYEWSVVHATAQAIDTGMSPRSIAASLGLTPDRYTDTLMRARKRARALWVAPGETPSRRRYAAGTRSKVHEYIRHHRAYAGQEAS